CFCKAAIWSTQDEIESTSRPRPSLVNSALPILTTQRRDSVSRAREEESEEEAISMSPPDQSDLSIPYRLPHVIDFHVSVVVILVVRFFALAFFPPALIVGQHRFAGLFVHLSTQLFLPRPHFLIFRFQRRPLLDPTHNILT